jgi:hypothetical protein
MLGWGFAAYQIQEQGEKQSKTLDCFSPKFLRPQRLGQK